MFETIEDVEKNKVDSTVNNSTNSEVQEKRLEAKRALLKQRLLENKNRANLAAKKIERVDSSRVNYPLSFSQQRLWFINTLEPNTSCLLYTSPSPRDRG